MVYLIGKQTFNYIPFSSLTQMHLHPEVADALHLQVRNRRTKTAETGLKCLRSPVIPVSYENTENKTTWESKARQGVLQHGQHSVPLQTCCVLVIKIKHQMKSDLCLHFKHLSVLKDNAAIYNVPSPQQAMLHVIEQLFAAPHAIRGT